MTRFPRKLAAAFSQLSVLLLFGPPQAADSQVSGQNEAAASAIAMLKGCHYSEIDSSTLSLLSPCSARIDHSVTLKDGAQIITNGYPVVIDLEGDLKINGFAIVRSFPASQPGAPRPSDGKSGRDANFFKIEIHGDAVGSLQIDNRGEDGDPGKTGDPGPNGQTGASGNNAADHLFDCAHGGGDGAAGGRGGDGGKGGQGGKGGNGGDLDVQVSGDSSKFTLISKLDPGTPGKGGEGGPGGHGGAGGSGGSGSTYCHGGHSGPPGIDGQRGATGDVGPVGLPGHAQPSRPTKSWWPWSHQ
jgi:hypothetical protein